MNVIYLAGDTLNKSNIKDENYSNYITHSTQQGSHAGEPLTKTQITMTDIDAIRGDISKVQFETRAESKLKWMIMFWIAYSWLSIFCSVASISSLEDTLLTSLNLTDSQFASLTTTVFVCAMFGALCSPYLISSYNQFYTLIFAQTVCFFGQSLATIACTMVSVDISGASDNESSLENNSSLFWWNRICLYIGRGMLGFGFGITDVGANTILNGWVGNSPWAAIAFMVTFTSIEVGVAATRYSLIPILNIDNKLWHPFFFCAVVNLIAIFSAFMTYYTELVYIDQQKRIIQTRLNNNKTHLDTIDD